LQTFLSRQTFQRFILRSYHTAFWKSACARGTLLRTDAHSSLCLVLGAADDIFRRAACLLRPSSFMVRWLRTCLLYGRLRLFAAGLQARRLALQQSTRLLRLCGIAGMAGGLSCALLRPFSAPLALWTWRFHGLRCKRASAPATLPPITFIPSSIWRFAARGGQPHGTDGRTPYAVPVWRSAPSMPTRPPGAL